MRHENWLAQVRRDESGEIKFLTIVLVAAIAGGVYWLSMWGPVWLDHLEVRKRCEQSVNSTWRRKDPSITRHAFLKNLEGVKKVEVDVGGVIEKRPAINPAPEDVVVEFDQSVTPPVLSIDVTYARVVKMPFLERERTFWFSDHCEVDTSEVLWE